MTKKQIAIIVYLSIAAVFSVYSTFWGDLAYKGFAYNLGRAVIWPAIIFPGLGQAIGGLIIVAIIGIVLMS